MCAAITSAAIGVAAAGYSIYEGEQKKKKAKDELNNYERETLTNAFENIQISTVGTDLLREESQRSTANVIDVIQGTGSRGISATLPRIQAETNSVNRQIQKDLDDQVIKRDYAIAEDDIRIRGTKENRDNQNINALSSQFQAGDAMTQNGVFGGMSALASMGRTIGATDSSFSNPQENSLSNSLTLNTHQSVPNNYNPFSNTIFQIPRVNDLFAEKQMYGNNYNL
ncbi:hypothetical protein [Flavobacterium sp. HSC-61S13]|uniref:hypothetical protein n=1 Tax=Flavobacterium sp. HSC-61S13 TaxID=2910963 RepID=UPI00209FA99D|nr:hypothetical protein [Flavobacterium sp. HSC-61S13]MCP1996648.1 hypothetical protein [Flavobacterium sp. HSC-61S13]